jgi:nuclear pore complex protein Nup133
VSGSTSSARNPRRRQRTQSNENGVSVPRAKRQRSALSDETFTSPEPTMNGKDGMHKLNGFTSQKPRSAASRQVVVRETKKIGERGQRLENGTLLVRKSDRAVLHWQKSNH